MPLSAMISSDHIVVEPGTTIPLNIEIHNSGTEQERVEIDLQGLDPNWTAIPVPTVLLEPGEKQSVKVFFKPPRESESTAGNYPFLAQVRSLETAETKTAQGILEVRPYHHVSIELAPRKGFVSATRRMNTFALTVINLGNSEHTIQLVANDPEDACAYEFEAEQVTIGPGQQRDVDVVVTPTRRTIFGASRLIGFAITGRSMEVPTVVSNAQAQLEIRPLFTAGTLTMFAVVLAMIYMLVMTMPKPPTVDLVIVGNKRVTQGSKVTVRWTSSQALRVKLFVANELVSDNLDPEGETEIDTPLPGTLSIQAIAVRDSAQSEPDIENLEVVEPEVVPEPKILELSVSRTTVNIGQKVQLRYKFNAAVVKAKIAPLNQELDLKVDSILLEPVMLGANTFTVVAENKSGKFDKRTITVNAVEPSLASILSFEASASEVAESELVRLSWSVTGAAKVEISYPGGTPREVDTTGTLEIPILAKTTFTLVATDEKGNAVKKSLTIKVKAGDGITVQPNDPGTNSGQ